MVNEKGTSGHGESHHAVFPLGLRDMAILNTTICNTAFIYFVDQYKRIWTNELLHELLFQKKLSRLQMILHFMRFLMKSVTE